MVKVTTKVREAVWEHVMIYKALVQMVFLYGSEIWVVTGVMLTVLEGFHHRVARQISGKTD